MEERRKWGQERDTYLITSISILSKFVLTVLFFGLFLQAAALLMNEGAWLKPGGKFVFDQAWTVHISNP